MWPVKLLVAMVEALVTTTFSTIFGWVLFPIKCIAEPGNPSVSLSFYLRGSAAQCTPWACELLPSSHQHKLRTHVDTNSRKQGSNQAVNCSRQKVDCRAQAALGKSSVYFLREIACLTRSSSKDSEPGELVDAIATLHTCETGRRSIAAPSLILASLVPEHDLMVSFVPLQCPRCSSLSRR